MIPDGARPTRLGRIPSVIALLPALLFLTCSQPESSASPKAVLEHHLASVVQGNLDEIMADYADNSVILTPSGPLRGPTAIRAFFAAMPEILPPGFWDNFEMVRQDIEGEVAFIVWTAGPTAPLGTDTFIIRDGRIVVQTFAAHLTAQ